MKKQIIVIKSILKSVSVVFYIALLLFPSPVSAQIKIYVNTDLEGISGVFKFDQTREKDTPLNIQACEYFMGDVAAVVRGLRDGGATEIVVLDGHGSQAVITSSDGTRCKVYHRASKTWCRKPVTPR